MEPHPGLELELQEELAYSEAAYGSSDRVRRATIVACLARLARDVHRHDGVCIAADSVLEGALDRTYDPPPALQTLIGEVRAFVDDAREPHVPAEVLAADALYAFLHERLLGKGDEQVYLQVLKQGEKVVATAKDTTFANEPEDVAHNLVRRIRGYADAYRPDGRFNVYPLLRTRMAFRLDDEPRVVRETAHVPGENDDYVSEMTYQLRYVRRLRESGRLAKDATVTVEAICSAREEGTGRQQHRVPAGYRNNKGVRGALRELQDEGGLDRSIKLGQRTVDQRICEFEEQRGAPYSRYGRSKAMPRADFPKFVEFIKTRHRG